MYFATTLEEVTENYFIFPLNISSNLPQNVVAICNEKVSLKIFGRNNKYVNYKEKSFVEQTPDRPWQGSFAV